VDRPRGLAQRRCAGAFSWMRSGGVLFSYDDTWRQDAAPRMTCAEIGRSDASLRACWA
jgi:hypothetical protein